MREPGDFTRPLPTWRKAISFRHKSIRSISIRMTSPWSTWIACSAFGTEPSIRHTVTAQVAYGLRNPEGCDQAIRVGVQGLQDIPALLPGRRQQRADHGKIHRPVHGAEAAGDLLA